MNKEVAYPETLEVMINLGLGMEAALEYKKIVHELFPNPSIKVPLSKFLDALKKSKNEELQSKNVKAKEILEKSKA